MSAPSYRIQFPASNSDLLGQDEVAFSVIENGTQQSLRFHDYAEIYDRPGLYEELFDKRLRCSSPDKVIELLGQGDGA